MAATHERSRQKRYSPLAGDDEYAVVQVRPSWGLMSILVFLYSLPVRTWTRYLPWHPTDYYYRPGTLVLTTLALSAFGMVLAWVGLRSSADDGKGRGPARMGLFLNATVFGVLVLAVGALAIYWRFLR